MEKEESYSSAESSTTRPRPNRASRLFPFDAPGNDPTDKFRPARCPHCLLYPSSKTADGYLCFGCSLGLKGLRRKVFLNAAAGICSDCEDHLTDLDRLQQKYICAACSNSQEMYIQQMADLELVGEIRLNFINKIQDNYTEKMETERERYGRCINIKCGKKMGSVDLWIPGYDNLDVHFTRCQACRLALRGKDLVNAYSRTWSSLAPGVAMPTKPDFSGPPELPELECLMAGDVWELSGEEEPFDEEEFDDEDLEGGSYYQNLRRALLPLEDERSYPVEDRSSACTKVNSNVDTRQYVADMVQPWQDELEVPNVLKTPEWHAYSDSTDSSDTGDEVPYSENRPSAFHRAARRQNQIDINHGHHVATLREMRDGAPVRTNCSRIPRLVRDERMVGEDWLPEP